MTPNQAKWALACLPMVQAFAEGKEIQCNTKVDGTGEWRTCRNPDWSCGPDTYRVKPEPREFWVNVYNTGRELGTQNEGYLHLTEASALRGRSNGAGRTDITTIKVREVLE